MLVDDDQATTKATARYLRGSASKAREVLDLIRGLDVGRADEVLRFTTRDVAKDIRKVLASAVANAVHNDEQDAEELFVLACSPTRVDAAPVPARARGRATRIRKRTCHITVVVARMSDERLEVVQARQEAQSATGRRRAGTWAQSRRDRVERSRARAQGPKEGADGCYHESPTWSTASPVPKRPRRTRRRAAARRGHGDEHEVVADEVEVEETRRSRLSLPEGAVAAPDDGSVPRATRSRATPIR